jgi:hypothetical protein
VYLNSDSATERQIGMLSITTSRDYCPLKTDSDIEAEIKNFNNIIQWAGWTTTPEHTEAH